MVFDKDQTARAGSGVTPYSVLITSISKKVPMVNAVRRATAKFDCAGVVIGADTNDSCLGRYFVDAFWSIPRDDQLQIEHVFTWCYKHRISVIFPSRDGELAFWAQHRNALSAKGISVMVSDSQAVAVCNDKLAFYQYFSGLDFPIIQTAATVDQIQGDRLVVKERFGAGSASAGIDLNRTQACERSSLLSAAVFQPFVRGDEISADVYISGDGEVRGVVLRRRDVVVDGESQVTTTFRDHSIETLCTAMAKSAGFHGHIMFQMLIDADGNPHVIECNCRFGGASTLSIEAGLDSFYWFIHESAGRDPNGIEFRRAPTSLQQIRFAFDKVIAA
jgi:carbamoyl-phosphate synthase large subunit